MTNEEKIDFIDTFLSQCEDYMHGQDGKDVTLSRKYLREIAEQVKNSVVLADVSQQRELLLAYHKHLDSFNDPTIYNASIGMIDDYLANNCG